MSYRHLVTLYLILKHSQSLIPDGYLSGEGFLLLLDLKLGSLQAQGFPGLQLLDAAIA